MPLAATMLNAVALSLVALGLLGAGLAVWQLLGWTVFGSLPPLADAWRDAGLTGEILAVFFARLPLVLLGAFAFHAALAWLGWGLHRRRPWARGVALAFAFAWAGLAAAGYALAQHALADLARGHPQYLHFASVAASLAAEVALVNGALAAALVLLLIQRAVRAQFSAGS
ncbi:MAG: hypothetical protein JSR54_05060 [Proteobacteria bacterium]|nr:hypothetical protein [Pseudomonadota bacterium]